MNKDNYKNAMNQIHASQKLKNKTLEKIEEKENKGIQWSRLIPTVCTLCVVMFFVTTFYLKNNR